MRGHGRGGHGRRRRRAARHDGRPAGHRSRLQDADRPGRRDRRRGPDLPGRGPDVRRVRGRRGADRDGRRRHARRPARGDARPPRGRGPDAEVRLHRPDVPEPGRRDDVAGAAAAARPHRHAARALRARGQPVRPAALRGRPAAAALRARRRRVRHLPRHVLEDPLAGPPARVDRGAAAGAREAQPRQAGRRPLLVHVRPVLRRRVLRAPRLARPARLAPRRLPPAPRRAARGARGAPPGRGASGRAPAAGLFIWATLPDVHRHDRPARARAARARGLRARAGPPTSTAAAAPRCGSTSPASARTTCARACGRIGKVVNEQVRLYSTLTGTEPRRPRRGRLGRAGRGLRTTRVRASSRCAAAPAASDEPRRGARGRAVARAAGLAALRRAGA